MFREKFVKLSIFFFVLAGVILVMGRIEWFPEFYDVRYMGWGSLIFAGVIVLSKPILRFILSAGKGHDDLKEKIVSNLQFVVAFMITLNGLGDLGLYQLYRIGFEFDKFAHFFSSLMATMALISVGIQWYNFSLTKAVIIGVVLVFLGGIVWEVFEFSADELFNTHLFGFYGTDISNDTYRDFVANNGGIILGVFVIAFKKGRKSKSAERT